MSVAVDLLRIVDEAHSLSRILDEAVRAIAAGFEVDACSAFLLDEGAPLRGLARTTAFRSEAFGTVEGTEAELVAAQALGERRTVALQGATSSLLASPMILRDSLVGAVVLQNVAHRDYSPDDVATLAASCGQLATIVENARIIEALDRRERPAARLPPRSGIAEPADGERTLRGVAASPGVAIGTAQFRGALRLDLTAYARPTGDPAAERVRVRQAIAKTHNDLLRIQAGAAREIDEEHALIFASHLLLLNDPMLLGSIDAQIALGVSAPVAIDASLDDFETRLRLVADTYIQEKIDDVDDLRSRLLDHVIDGGARARSGMRVVISNRTPPSLLVELKTEGAQALVAEVGGATSHGVLLARAMSIPVVTGIPGIVADVRPDDRLIVDGTNGVVVVRPTGETVARYEAERRRIEHVRTEYVKYRDVLARTADGVRVTMHANVGVASDLAIARDNGAEGVGLYRTEFPFLVRDAFPTRAEQVRIYAKAYEIFPVATIRFRILDLGGDKFLSGGSVATARNAFHGYRSIRVLFDHPDILRDQVQAFAIAAGDRPLRILIPMVSSMEELRRVKEAVHQALASLDDPRAQRAPEIGAMIEVPAAVELAADIAREVDFLSIGTNDLMQYALVVDREDARMAQMGDPYHPAILRMIARVAAAAHSAGKPVGVCGEIAVRPDIALAMVALGIDSLSVVPTAIPELKQVLAGLRLEPLRRAIGEIIGLSDAASLAAALREACSA
ncbi:MAG TPA: phosphoenolpyruvate--protein phosphotransferase [Polyangiaceae bacterium]|nr:phosphoenolpyruvate--protein phosphotransferase [Polyangiaceae bacterium]